MKIMSFNTQHCLNYITREIDFRVMADAILSVGADIVGLNEMRGKGVDPDYDRQTEILSEMTGLPYYYFAKAIDVGGENPYGNAILSRYPLLSAETVMIDEPENPIPGKHYERRCILKAKIESGLTLLVTHFGLSPEERVQAVRGAVSLLERERCILMGDFNATPADPVLLPIRERLRDAAELFEKPLLSFPSSEPVEKIDYIFVSRDLSIVSADIPPIVASDHRPHTAEIVF